MNRAYCLGCRPRLQVGEVIHVAPFERGGCFVGVPRGDFFVVPMRPGWHLILRVTDSGFVANGPDSKRDNDSASLVNV